MIEGLRIDVLASPKSKGSSFLSEWIPSLRCKEYACAKTIFEWRQTCHAFLPVSEAKRTFRQIHLIYYIQHKDYICSRSTHIFQYVEMAKCFHFWLIHFEDVHENTSPGKQKHLVQMSMFHITYVQINILCHGIYYLFVFENLSALAIKSHLQSNITKHSDFGECRNNLANLYQLISGFGRTK